MTNEATWDRGSSRRIFFQTMAYMPPTILTMSALASVASAASGGPHLEAGPDTLKMGNRIWGW